MAQRPIREYDGKRVLHRNWPRYLPDFHWPLEAAQVRSGEQLVALAGQDGYGWLREKPLVAKPDMVFGKRGKNGLVHFQVDAPGDVDLAAAAHWIDARRQGRTRLIGGQEGLLSNFLVEPFVPHAAEQEYYISAVVAEQDDLLTFSTRGGVDVEAHWDAAVRLAVPALIADGQVEALLDPTLPAGLDERDALVRFVAGFYRLFRDLHFAYLEVNPFVLVDEGVHLLDLVAKVDDTAGYLMHERWGGELYYPTPFGMPAPGPEERAIKAMDEKSGASLKLTVLNPRGRIWTLVAGGGASVVYADTIADLTGVEDLANYGEYSGNPSADETYLYARTVLDLMTREPDPAGRDKVLIIGGAIANFTDVAKTFSGIIRALREYHEAMKRVGVRIYVRRGGPNYEVGLRRIQAEADKLGLPIEVHGPQIHLTEIVRRSLAA